MQVRCDDHGRMYMYILACVLSVEEAVDGRRMGGGRGVQSSKERGREGDREEREAEGAAEKAGGPTGGERAKERDAGETAVGRRRSRLWSRLVSPVRSHGLAEHSSRPSAPCRTWESTRGSTQRARALSRSDHIMVCPDHSMCAPA